MKENSTEENIKLLEEFSNENVLYGSMVGMTLEKYKDLQLSAEHVLSDYKRVLKENEELKEENEYNKILLDMNNNFTIDKKTGNYKWNVIEIQKIKDKIEDLKMSGGSDGKDNTENTARELAIEALQDILEESEE